MEESRKSEDSPPESQPQAPALTRLQTARSLRAFITASGLWGAWGQATGIGTSVFTGYALLLGGDESFIALCTAVAYLLGATQIIFPLLGSRLRSIKRFVVTTGSVEILLRGGIVLVPILLASSAQLSALLVLLSISLLCGYSVSPFYTTWIANTVPERSRAQFTSRQTITSTIIAMIAGFAIGQFIDLFSGEGKHQAFNMVFLVGTIFGLAGYLSLSRATYSRAERVESGIRPKSLLQPLKNTNFRRAAVAYGLWTFAAGLAGSLYSVFMIKQLQISYTEISIFNAIFMIASIAGYKAWAGLVDRFGSKSVLRLILWPTILIPFVWILNEPGSYYFVPIALTMSGLLISGLAVSITPLLFGLVPDGEQRPVYMATWSATVNLIGAMGPLCGSLLVRYLEPIDLEIAGFSIGNLQIIFAISGLLRVAPIILLGKVRDAREIPSRQLLANVFTGNLLSYAFNSTVYNLVSTEERRAKAVLAMGRSGHPLAIDQLVQALADASPKVRSSAARALGETDSPLASDSLIRELLNEESDIRSEAAEALGTLGHVGNIDPLVQALDDDDPRVRISAIRGLADSRLEEAQELLFWHFSDDFNPLTFPTLVDSLGSLGDRRIVKPTLLRLEQFRSPAIRLQLLNGVCRAMGTGDQFYRLLSQSETELPQEISRLLRRSAANLTTSPILDVQVRNDLRLYFRELVQAHENENAEWMVESVRKISTTIRDGLRAHGKPAYEILSLFVVIVALNNFLDSRATDDLPEASEIFLTVCVNRLAVLIRSLQKRT